MSFKNFQFINSTTETPEWFLKTIGSIVSQKNPTPLGVSLRFDLSDEAATYNMNIL
jgi:hypothetical protein